MTATDDVMTCDEMWRRHADIAKIPRGIEQRAAYAALCHAYHLQFATPATYAAIANCIVPERNTVGTWSANEGSGQDLVDLEKAIKPTCDMRKLALANPPKGAWSLKLAVSIAQAVAHDIKSRTDATPATRAADAARQ